MSCRVKFNCEYSISENSNQSKELGQSSPWTGATDALDDGGTWRRRIAASASDVLIDINGLTAARFIAIKTNKTITIKKNSDAGEPWTVMAMGTGAAEGFLIMTTDGVTALYVSNAGPDVAEVTFSIAGTIE